jgi:hypothetical protein
LFSLIDVGAPQRTSTQEFMEKASRFIGAKCCAMTMIFDEMTKSFVDLSKTYQNRVNARREPDSGMLTDCSSRDRSCATG